MALESSGEFALTVIANTTCNFGDAEASVGEQFGSPFHAVLFDVGSERVPIDRLENVLQSGGIHVKLSGECVDGDFLIHVFQQIIVYLMNELSLIRPAVRQKNCFFRTGDAHRLLDDVMQKLSDFTVRSPVEDLFSLTVADDKSCVPQRPEMMRNSRARHAQYGRNVRWWLCGLHVDSDSVYHIER